MKPVFKDGKFTVKLHTPDKAILEKASDIGHALIKMNQATGQPLVDAVKAILKQPAETKPAAETAPETE